MTNYKMYINGEWVSGAEKFDVLNPATEEVLGTVPVASDAEVLIALEDANEAHRE